jgi:hypothetical protein
VIPAFVVRRRSKSPLLLGKIMNQTNPSRVRYENSQTILRVENMEASLRFYVGVLGFANANWGNEDFTSVNRDCARIYLCRGGQGRGGAWAGSELRTSRSFIGT